MDKQRHGPCTPGLVSGLPTTPEEARSRGDGLRWLRGAGATSTPHDACPEDAARVAQDASKLVIAAHEARLAAEDALDYALTMCDHGRLPLHVANDLREAQWLFKRAHGDQPMTSQVAARALLAATAAYASCPPGSPRRLLDEAEKKLRDCLVWCAQVKAPLNDRTEFMHALLSAFGDDSVMQDADFVSCLLHSHQKAVGGKFHDAFLSHSAEEALKRQGVRGPRQRGAKKSKDRTSRLAAKTANATANMNDQDDGQAERYSEPDGPQTAAEPRSFFDAPSTEARKPTHDDDMVVQGEYLHLQHGDGWQGGWHEKQGGWHHQQFPEGQGGEWAAAPSHGRAHQKAVGWNLQQAAGPEAPPGPEAGAGEAPVASCSPEAIMEALKSMQEAQQKQNEALMTMQQEQHAQYMKMENMRHQIAALLNTNLPSWHRHWTPPPPGGTSYLYKD